MKKYFLINKRSSSQQFGQNSIMTKEKLLWCVVEKDSWAHEIFYTIFWFSYMAND
jgi:hypothetical protein